MIVCFCIGASALFSQDLKKLSLSFYGGAKVLSPSLNEDWPIRQDVSYGYYGDEFNAQVNLNGDIAYFGVSPEYLINKHWSISSGLRFSKYFSSIIKDDNCIITLGKKFPKKLSSFLSLRAVSILRRLRIYMWTKN